MNQLNLKNCVLERIEREGVCPRPRVWFQTRECVVWTLWLISVIVGALAVAVTLYALIVRQYALYEVTHGSFWWSIFGALPYIWLGAFAVMVIFAVYNIRHTKRGYRYSLPVIIISSVLASFVTGLGLHIVGLGFMTDNILGKQLSLYPSQEKYERMLWQQPFEGRILALWVAETGVVDQILVRDIENVVWTVDVSILTSEEYAAIRSAELTKLIGLVTDEINKNFVACASASWFLEKPMSRSQLFTEREAFWKRMHHESQKAYSPKRAHAACARLRS